MSFKGVRFAQPVIGERRWQPPAPFLSAGVQNATAFGGTCLQAFSLVSAALDQLLFNNPSDPPRESEDCLFLNVFAPAPTGKDLPVFFWIYGGALQFGSSSLPTYDGTSFVTNQNIIVVTFNYRTNVFGFPGSPDLPLAGNNLGFLDQELALQWVRLNIAKFGGDPNQITIAGESAGAQSVAAFIARHSSSNAPFRAGIMFSGAAVSTSPIPSFDAFNGFASSLGCTQAPGPARLACLKRVPAPAIRNFTNGPTAGSFEPVVDGITSFSDPLQRIRSGLSAEVPFVIGNMQNDGSLFALGVPDLATFLNATFGNLLTPAQVRPFYPGLNDTQVIAAAIRDTVFQCPAQLWSSATVGAGVANVYRYIYGAVFADLQLFPNAGAWHSSELPEVFGTFNRTSATAAEATLSHTMQTAIANFVKNPTAAAGPAPNWARGSGTVAKLAFNGNADTGNVVQPVAAASVDGPCALWDKFLDIRE